ncbi:hypothetical protein MK805_01620 [Shimazuella sp. AN120528]|uniref:hypothetical protein n=1 Tax=Shimazuella soli TaxID=1892854 RepID=UPI001F0DA37B|nr:hypothetical protein [Shimazuella soli]MCH5583670.1 hypothetical protein [Shimazuella soli]
MVAGPAENYLIFESTRKRQSEEQILYVFRLKGEDSLRLEARVANGHIEFRMRGLTKWSDVPDSEGAQVEYDKDNPNEVPMVVFPEDSGRENIPLANLLEQRPGSGNS